MNTLWRILSDTMWDKRSHGSVTVPGTASCGCILRLPHQVVNVIFGTLACLGFHFFLLVYSKLKLYQLNSTSSEAWRPTRHIDSITNNHNILASRVLSRDVHLDLSEIEQFGGRARQGEKVWWNGLEKTLWNHALPTLWALFGHLGTFHPSPMAMQHEQRNYITTTLLSI